MRFSAGGAAVAEVAALPVVWDLLSVAAAPDLASCRALGRGVHVAGLAVAALGLHFLAALGRILGRVRSRSACSSTSRPASGCCPERSCRRPVVAALSAESAPFMPDVPPLSRCMVPDGAPPRSEDGALCCAVEPADPASWPMPVPCAFAKPVPAIKAAAATEIKKRLLIEFLLTCSALPDRQRKELRDVPEYRRFRRLCFVNAG